MLRAHASTRERVPHLERFYAGIWRETGLPARVNDLGCGLNPIALPWMRLDPEATYRASDVDRRSLDAVDRFLDVVGQPHRAELRDVVTGPPSRRGRRGAAAQARPDAGSPGSGSGGARPAGARARHAVVTFPARSLGGRGKGMEHTYRDRLERLVSDAGRVATVAEASVPNELVFVLALEPLHG